MICWKLMYSSPGASAMWRESLWGSGAVGVAAGTGATSWPEALLVESRHLLQCFDGRAWGRGGVEGVAARGGQLQGHQACSRSQAASFGTIFM